MDVLVTVPELQGDEEIHEKAYQYNQRHGYQQVKIDNAFRIHRGREQLRGKRDDKYKTEEENDNAQGKEHGKLPLLPDDLPKALILQQIMDVMYMHSLSRYRLLSFKRSLFFLFCTMIRARGKAASTHNLSRLSGHAGM
jgi:hypothetical protein